jgi:hypothetical protein
MKKRKKIEEDQSDDDLSEDDNKEIGSVIDPLLKDIVVIVLSNNERIFINKTTLDDEDVYDYKFTKLFKGKKSVYFDEDPTVIKEIFYFLSNGKFKDKFNINVETLNYVIEKYHLKGVVPKLFESSFYVTMQQDKTLYYPNTNLLSIKSLEVIPVFLYLSDMVFNGFFENMKEKRERYLGSKVWDYNVKVELTNSQFISKFFLEFDHFIDKENIISYDNFKIQRMIFIENESVLDKRIVKCDGLFKKN